MNTILLILTACLSSGQCRDFRVTLDAGIGIFECDIHGQEGAVEWMREHPSFVVRRWRCEVGGREGRT